MTTCQCGCGKATFVPSYNCRTFGWEAGVPRPYARGHSRRRGQTWAVDEDSGCWNWTGSLRNGYGSFWLDGRQTYGHRWSYEKHVGPIPDGLQIDHLCRNKRCVNPDHLEPVSSLENTRRAAKLTPATAREIRESTEDARAVAARYGITRSYVYDIRNGKVWQGAS